ncbi:O-antigen ligase-like membrane protein [Flavobacterium sp. 9]|uniref:O-antigen ligase family protein n=1 Tax=Flavobacterium sp. 9 TaxID=2035198 RepID=UPI000C1A3E10|nr:O-antigen ligase family protein [Flavobacterium sp. 9]PIF32101.1 O-antigen ligase-like membrane protein [Flavobacterium sp. 9]
MKINTNNLKLILTVCLITFCIQTPDVKLGFVKISELLLLLITPFLLKKSINKFIFYFFVFFTIEMILGLIITSTHHFDILGPSKFKAPYVITIARYFELVTCISLCIITFRLFKNNTDQSKKIIDYLVNWNILITAFFFLVYILVKIGLLSIQNSIVVYDTNRLRGLYNEGGPFGLMLSFIFILTFFQQNTRYRFFKQLFLFIIIAFFARSKAGILFVVIWIALFNFEILKNKLRAFIFPIILVFLVGFYFLFMNVSSMYVTELNRVKQSVKERPTDINLILGRVSGVYIVPNMIEENPIFGIGLGNYPLLRNNAEYRSFFPKPPKESIDIDAHGFGGIIDIIVEMGILGFFFFMFIVYGVYYEIKNFNKGIVLLLGFILIYCFGVQIYFLYPWVLMAIILAYRNNYIDEISN